MHVFQPLSTEFFDVNPFEKIGKEWMLITAGNKEKANTMTASWGGFGVLWGKNVVYIFVRESRYTKEFIDRNSGFSLSFFDEKPKGTIKYLGAVSGRDEDKISNAGLNINYYKDIPFIDEAKTILICNKMAETVLSPLNFITEDINEKWYKDNDYHTMYVGEIIELMAR